MFRLLLLLHCLPPSFSPSSHYHSPHPPFSHSPSKYTIFCPSPSPAPFISSSCYPSPAPHPAVLLLIIITTLIIIKIWRKG